MKSSSLKMIKDGIPRPKEYRDSLIHEWYLPSSIVLEHLEVFTQLRGYPAMIFSKIKDGELSMGKHSYSVIWVNSPASISRYSDQVLMSFRFCKHLQVGYVLIKDYKKNPQTEVEPKFYLG